MNCLILLTDLLPDDPDVIVGQNLSMTCQLHSDHHHARDLRFEFHFYHERKKNLSAISRKRKVSRSDTYLVNASVVELHYSNVRPRYDRAMISCYHRNKQRLHDSQIIKVGCEWFLYLVYHNFTVFELYRHTLFCCFRFYCFTTFLFFMLFALLLSF